MAPPSSPTACKGAASETCGGTDALALLNFTCAGKPLPNYNMPGKSTGKEKDQKNVLRKRDEARGRSNRVQ